MTTSTTHPSHQLITIGPKDDECPIGRAMRTSGASAGEAVPKAAALPEPEGKPTRPKRFNARRMAPLKKRRRAKGGRGHRRRRWRR